MEESDLCRPLIFSIFCLLFTNISKASISINTGIARDRVIFMQDNAPASAHSTQYNCGT
jgi:hypothetical protein